MWAVANLQPNGLRQAQLNLGRQDFESYAPRYFCPDSRRAELLFPGYLLILIVDVWRSLLGTRGISSLIMSGGSPSELSDDVVAKLRDCTGPDGLVVVPSLKRGSGRPYRREGTPLMVHDRRSNFFGKHAIYQESLPGERCAVLLRLLGRSVRTEMREGDLAAI